MITVIHILISCHSVQNGTLLVQTMTFSVVNGDDDEAVRTTGMRTKFGYALGWDQNAKKSWECESVQSSKVRPGDGVVANC